MAATMIKFLCVAILFSFILGGCQSCSQSNLNITQSATGKLVQDKPEWNVTISNDCTCTQSSVILSCDGFQTVEDIDPSVLSKSGTECLVDGGNPIYGHTTFSFNYAYSTSFPFEILTSQVSCS